MKILIPYRSFSIGGPVTFLRTITAALTEQGHTISVTFTGDFDRLFIIDSCPLYLPLYAKLRGKKIIQRLDGVYYPALPGMLLGRHRLKNLRLKLLHNYLADHVVYQSEFSRVACTTMLGQPHGTWSVIYNGAALPAEETPALAKASAGKAWLEPPSSPSLPSEAHRAKLGVEKAGSIKLVTHASFRNPEQIIPLTRALKHLLQNFSLTIIGPHTSKLHPLIRELENGKRFTYKAAVKHSDIYEELSRYDIYVFSQISACPNSVLEALVVGLPVVAYDRGGLKELVASGKSGEIVSLRPHNPFYERYQFNRKDDQAFANAVLKVSQNLAAYSQAARTSAAQKFSLENMVREYLAAITSQEPQNG